MPFPKPWTDPAHVGDFFNFLPFGLSSLGCTMHGREPGRRSRTQGGRTADCNFLACNKTEEKKESREEKKLPIPNQWQDEVTASPLGFLSAAWRTSPGKATSTHPHSGAEHYGSNKSILAGFSRLVHLAAGAP